MVVSSFALLVAMSGTSYAAMQISGSDIVDGTVTTKDVRDDSLRGKDIRDGSLRAKDFGGQLPAGPEGPQGPAGPAGEDGVGRWLLVGANGEILAQSGGFTMVAAYPTLPNTAPDGQPSNALRANGNVYINAGEDLSDNGIVASIVLQNTVDQDGNMNTNGRAPGPDANAEFSGEISVSRCNFMGNTGVPIPTNCAPADAQNANSFVVSPRLSDGSVTTDGNRKAFYVIVTG
jgi:hypothetical protein